MVTMPAAINGIFAATFQCPTLVHFFFIIQCIWTGVMGLIVTYDPTKSPINDTGSFTKKGFPMSAARGA